MEIAKLGRGFIPASEDAEAVHRRMSPGELVWVDVLRVRDIVMHRRYWGLMTLCARNCERVVTDEGAVIPIRNKDDMHRAVKLMTGLCEYIYDAETKKPLLAIPKSTNFEEMTADEWAEYWPRVTDVVMQKVMRGVSEPTVELELLKCMGLAS